MRSQSIERFSTDDARPEARLSYWNDLASQTFNNLTVDAAEPATFSGEMIRAPLGPISLMSAASAAASVRRGADPTRPVRIPRAFDLHFQLIGRSYNTQAGREAVLEAGDFTLCDASQPYSVSFTEANHMLCLKMPAELVASRLGDVERMVCVPMSAQRGGAAMFSSFLRTVWAQLQDEPGDDGWGETVADVILDLLTLVYRPLLPGAGSQRAARLRQAQAHIQDGLCDPELDVGTVAEAMGVSARYLQLVFAEAGTTPSAYILERRLDLAAERLRHGVGRGGVTQVALAVGFNDLTHFGRAFRRRFGVSPSDYNAGARAPRWSRSAPGGEGAADAPHLVLLGGG